MALGGFVCRRCCRPLTKQIQFFLTNCYHLFCLDCVKKCVARNVPCDPNGLYSLVCPVEQKLRKFMALEKLPPDGQAMFKNLNKVVEELVMVVKLVEKRMDERMLLIQHLAQRIKSLRKQNARLLSRVERLRLVISKCRMCSHSICTSMNESVCSSQDSLRFSHPRRSRIEDHLSSVRRQNRLASIGSNHTRLSHGSGSNKFALSQLGIHC